MTNRMFQLKRDPGRPAVNRQSTQLTRRRVRSVSQCPIDDQCFWFCCVVVESELCRQLIQETA